MSNLRKFKDEERESEYGRVYAVSGNRTFIRLCNYDCAVRVL